MKNTRKLISSGSTFEKEIGYSRALVDGDWVFVSGTSGYDYKSMSLAGDIVSQTKQCLKNIERERRFERQIFVQQFPFGVSPFSFGQRYSLRKRRKRKWSTAAPSASDANQSFGS
jgi:hypothetical protein